MSQLSKLKLVAVQATRKSPALSRRHKLNAQITTQIAMAKAQTEGVVFAATRQKYVQDEQTGERKAVQVSKRAKPWWFTAADGKIAMTVRYGARVIEIAKGKNAVQVSDMAELVATLEIIADAVQEGELDAQIEQASVSLRAGFSKKSK